jgi:uncharacterized protein CbrC (UPF0167 family)
MPVPWYLNARALVPECPCAKKPAYAGFDLSRKLGHCHTLTVVLNEGARSQVADLFEAAADLENQVYPRWNRFRKRSFS